MFKLALLVVMFLVVGLAADQKAPPVVIDGIEIEGTHLPRESIIRLMGLRIGQTVDTDTLLAACDRMSKTGLVADINYSFRQDPGKAGSVVVFKFWDEKPLLPATVFPPENETAAWACLQSADPIFSKQLPNTVNALKFYVANLDKCITETAARPLHAVAKVVCDANSKPARIEFRIEPGTEQSN